MKYPKARLAMQDANRDTPRSNLTTESVRRKLDFGGDEKISENHSGQAENCANELIEEMSRDCEKAKERWNFDFENERPLSGNWQWIKVGENEEEVENSIGSESRKIPETSELEGRETITEDKFDIANDE